MKTICTLAACCFIWAIATNCASAQSNAAEKSSILPELSENDSLISLPKTSKNLYFIPYTYPYSNNFVVKNSKLPLQNSLLMKRSSAENAMNSIYLTLEKEKEQATKYKVANIIFEAAIFGGVAYQMLNSKRLVDREKERREMQKTPPVRR